MRTRLNLVFLMMIVVTIGLSSCDSPNIQQRQISRDYIHTAEDFREWTNRANAGDAAAAFGVAKIYDKSDYFVLYDSESIIFTAKNRVG